MTSNKARIETFSDVEVEIDHNERVLTLDFADMPMGKITDVRNVDHGFTPVDFCDSWGAASVSLIHAMNRNFKATCIEETVIGPRHTVQVRYDRSVSSAACYEQVRDFMEKSLGLTCTFHVKKFS